MVFFWRKILKKKWWNQKPGRPFTGFSLKLPVPTGFRPISSWEQRLSTRIPAEQGDVQDDVQKNPIAITLLSLFAQLLKP
jgi:hypothetical protein